MGGDPSTTELRFGRNTVRKKAWEIPRGDLGRGLGDLRNVIVDVITNALNLSEAARRSAAIERRQSTAHLKKMQRQAASYSRKMSTLERSKRKKLERENKDIQRKAVAETEAAVKDRCVAYEAKCTELDDQVRTLQMEVSFLKAEAEKKSEEHANAMEYAHYRARSDAESTSQEVIEQLKNELARHKLTYQSYQSEMKEKMREQKEGEKQSLKALEQR